MFKTIDGIPSDQVQHLWIIMNDNVVQYVPEPKQGFTKQELISYKCVCGYSTEVAATQALIKDLEYRLASAVVLKLTLEEKLNNVKNSECLTLKVRQSTKKTEKVGNIRI